MPIRVNFITIKHLLSGGWNHSLAFSLWPTCSIVLIFTDTAPKPSQSTIWNVYIFVCAITENSFPGVPGDFWSKGILLILTCNHTIFISFLLFSSLPKIGELAREGL